jgi:hypothetical protein
VLWFVLWFDKLANTLSTIDDPRAFPDRRAIHRKTLPGDAHLSLTI